ncbi:MAG: hemin uptake protein HemP [Rubrivivax sp.]|nr:hemin uptake protein HemP [Rubrivivax sp.]
MPDPATDPAASAPASGSGRPDSVATDPAQGEPRVLRSEDLLAGRAEVLIGHGPQTYRLRRTLTGKLILTK